MIMVPTTPTSPLTPMRKRWSLRIPSFQSNDDYIPSSPRAGNYKEGGSRSTKSSQSSPHQLYQNNPRLISPRSKRPSSSRLSIGSNISTGLASNAGFGNLADELEDVWDLEYDGPDSSFLQDLQEGDQDEPFRSPASGAGTHDLTLMMSPQSPTTTVHNLSQSPEKLTSPSKQWASMGTAHRKTESLYDGSDYGPSSDGEAFDSIPPTLQRRIHDVEEITRISTSADALSELGGVVSRTTTALRDNLGAQSAIESGITRLITAYTSMGTHRTHQARELSNASLKLTNSNSFAPTLLDLPEEIIDSLIAELEALISTLPFISTSPRPNVSADPLATLQALATNTHELFSILHSLGDTLTEDRQHLLIATRRLKSVRDLVEELRMEEELVETSVVLIQAGDWDRRCRERHAGKAVTEVLEGFRKAWDVDYVEGCWKPPVTSRREIQVQ